MRRKKSKVKPAAAIRFITNDKWGCAVSCTEQTWQSHVIDEHKEMIGREAEVQKVIQDPQAVYPSTKVGSSLAFEGTATETEIRVLVSYEQPDKRTLGNTNAKVQTAYPVDRTKYNAPNLGPPIFVRPAPTIEASKTTKRRKEDEQT